MKDYLKYAVVMFLIALSQGCSVKVDEAPMPNSKGARVPACGGGGFSYYFTKEGPSDGAGHYYALGSNGFKKLIKVTITNFSTYSRYAGIRVHGQLAFTRVVSQTGGTVQLTDVSTGYAQQQAGYPQYSGVNWGVTVPAYSTAELILELRINEGANSVEGVSYLSLTAPCSENHYPYEGGTYPSEDNLNYYVVSNSSL